MLLPALKSFLSRFTTPNPGPAVVLASGQQDAECSMDQGLAQTSSISNVVRMDFYNDLTNQDGPTPNFFHNARNFVLHNPSIISQTIQSVIQLLAPKRLAGAEFNSSDRDPPPRCHPDTRLGLRSRILQWYSDPQRPWQMLWVLGPAGVGKTAVAQTIAEDFRASGHLGASFFFSRSNHWNDPDRVIPTLAYQLAVCHPGYKRIITERLAQDPGILDTSRRSQFRQLIVEPCQELLLKGYTRPLLVILDGLDECQGEEAQIEFVELISDYTQSSRGPLLWMVCSRPEWHFKHLLSRVDFHIGCLREELNVDDPEARKDVFSFLRASFDRIRERYSDRLDAHWPPEPHFRQISTASSGHFAFSSTLTRFIGDKNQSDPERQLNLCLEFLDGDAVGTVNPLQALDRLYCQILSNIPQEILPTTMRILGLCILYPQYHLSARDQANFLCIDRTTYHRALQNLHSVIGVPSASESHYKSIHFYHASFEDFLRRPYRSGRYSLDPPTIHYDVATHCLRWNQRAIVASRIRQGMRYLQFPELKWIGELRNQDAILDTLTRFSMVYGWQACTLTAGDRISDLVTQLEEFDFSGLREPPWRFLNFLHWLFLVGHQINKPLIRGVSTAQDVQDARKISNVLTLIHSEEDTSASGSFDLYSAKTEVRTYQLGSENRACIIKVVIYSRDMDSDLLAYHDII
ncbi:hypothetical protein D9756_009308 [Leucocoprinus leucothites]|uniref:Nephrocystin 3-like N-terminal domain-containing protein n=1 Tax=Leucocoprinus leucothites TaxID=201217 RepID=A0A8H5CZD0_9AGAR|nr:hypothetical protein D9756_009308 [Leucoagaricus leucothites]